MIIYSRLNGISLWSIADLVAIASPPGLLFGRIANFINVELWGRPTSLPWGVIFPGQRAQECPEVIGPCARHPSQLYEAGLEGILLFSVLLVLAFRGGLKRPAFLTGVLQLDMDCPDFVEYFRVPDPQFFFDLNPYGYTITFSNLGLTMGQLLSIPMIAAGMFLIFLVPLITVKK